MARLFIATYTNPDLDAVSCCIAYREYLQKKGDQAETGIFGAASYETELVMKKFNIKPIPNMEIQENDTIILVDTSSPFNLSEKINLNKVAEMIDHHKLNTLELSETAKTELEPVGACATLITEKFQTANLPISSQSATLLYYAIISNTINFHSNVTTDRDRKAAEYLMHKFKHDPDYTTELFKKKSALKQPLAEMLEKELAIQDINGTKIGISQLEMTGAGYFISRNLSQIRAFLKKTQAEKGLKIALVSCIDIEEYFNMFVVADKESRIFAEKVLDSRFRNDKARKEGILMRKEIWPLAKEEIER
jgi:manganese-dependent inorganic pyrophosphatase